MGRTPPSTHTGRPRVSSVDLAIVSDSHVPDRATAIPKPFRERMRAADRVVHAGDFESGETLAAVRELAGDLTAVRGNVDPAGLTSRRSRRLRRRASPSSSPTAR